MTLSPAPVRILQGFTPAMREEWRARAWPLSENITPDGIYAAWALAHAFGHAWGIAPSRAEMDAAVVALREGRSVDEALVALPEEQVEFGVQPATWEEAQACWHIDGARCGNSWPGIALTHSFGHRTGSGRLAWGVHPTTGAVSLSVYRPGRDEAVLRVMTFEGRVVVERAERGAYHLRHLEALEEALRAFGRWVPEELWADVADEEGTVLAELRTVGSSGWPAGAPGSPWAARRQALALLRGWVAWPMRRGVSAAFARLIGRQLPGAALDALRFGSSVQFVLAMGEQ